VTPLPRFQAQSLPVGSVVSTDTPNTLVPNGRTVLTRVDRPGRCPWRLGPADSNRYVATWRVQDLINDGADVNRPAQAGVKRR
jgi:hypothetical protein